MLLPTRFPYPIHAVPPVLPMIYKFHFSINHLPRLNGNFLKQHLGNLSSNSFVVLGRLMSVTLAPFRDAVRGVLGLAVFAGVAMGADVTLDKVSSAGLWTNVPVTGGNDAKISTTNETNYTWSGTVEQSGRYEVFVFVPAGAAGVKNVGSATNIYPEIVYTVVAADGSHRVAVNQKTSANQSISLGTFDFSANSTAQLHLSPNNYQIGEYWVWGTNQLWVSYQAPKLVWRAASTVPAPLRRILVISANTAIKPDVTTTEKWFCEYHGQAAAPSLATLKVWAKSNQYALTEAYDAGWSHLDSLALYDAVVINYEPPTFNAAQITALRGYIQLGGGLVGTHSSVNINKDIAQMLGADFTLSHPYTNYPSNTTVPLLLTVTSKGATHPSTRGILRTSNPSNPQYGCCDEWYLWNNNDTAQGESLLVESNGVLPTKDRSYINPHPVSWQRDSSWWQTANQSRSSDPGQGRVWYSSMGHDGWYHFPGTRLNDYRLDPVAKFTPKPPVLGSGVFTFYEHLTGGIAYAMGESTRVSILPQLSTAPTNKIVTVGQSATFTVVASGTATLSYQWQSLINAVWTNINGATSANYTKTTSALSENGTQFRVVVTNSYTTKATATIPSTTASTSITSTAVTLTVTAVPTTVAPLITAAIGGTRQVALTWGAVTGASTYTVKSSPSAEGPFNVVGTNLTATTYTHTGLADGTTTYYVVTATNGGGESAPSAVTVAKTYTGLDNWRLAYFGSIAATGSAASTADPDGDGVVNLLEYALSTHPTVANSAALTVGGAVAGKLTLSFFRARDDLTYSVESTADLVTWTTVATNPGTVGQTVVANDTVDLATATPQRRFLRLRVTMP